MRGNRSKAAASAHRPKSRRAVTYRPRPKRNRRTKAEVEALRDAIYSTCEGSQPLTVRNLFYQMVSAGHVQKSEADYRNVVVRLAGEMREAGDLPWEWLVDSARWMRKPISYAGLADLLEHSAEFYRRDLWAQLPIYLETWCESESIAGVLYDVTSEFDVPLMPAKGFSSKAFLFNSAATIAAHNKNTVVLYVGDYDPSGEVARNDVHHRLSHYLERWFDFRMEFEFLHVAITEEQVDDFDLPTRPPKTTNNTHARSIGWRADKGTVEAEALRPDLLRLILRQHIERHIPPHVLAGIRAVEDEERMTLERMRLEHLVGSGE